MRPDDYLDVNDDALEDLIDDDADFELPDFRITVVDEEVFLVDWTPALAYGGPPGQLFVGRDEDGVTIADVTLHRASTGERDAIVDVLSGGDDQAREVLTDWAHATGQRRIWFSDCVVELDGQPAQLGTAHTRCTACRAPFRESWHEFWIGVRESGRFPSICPLCGGTLPQWTAEQPHDSPRSFVTADRTAHANE